MSIPILMEIVFFLGCCTWCCTYYAHSSNPDTKCTRMPHLLSDQPAQKKRDRSGREIAPQQWHQHPVKKLRLFWPLKSATRPKAKTEAQILAQWRNRAPVYTRHPLAEVEVWCLIRLATGTWLEEGRLRKIAQRMWQAKPAGRKFLPPRNRILPPAASLEVWLRGMPVLASFLYWKAVPRAWAGHRQKILTRRNRISGRAAFSGGLAAQNARPSFFPVARGA